MVFVFVLLENQPPTTMHCAQLQAAGAQHTIGSEVEPEEALLPLLARFQVRFIGPGNAPKKLCTGVLRVVVRINSLC